MLVSGALEPTTGMPRGDRAVDERRGGVGVDRVEQDGVEFLHDHLVELAVLRHLVVVGVKDRDLHLPAFDGGMFLELLDPGLDELALEAVDGGADAVGFGRRVGVEHGGGGEAGEGEGRGQGLSGQGRMHGDFSGLDEAGGLR